jgi:hypothetical protein
LGLRQAGQVVRRDIPDTPGHWMEFRRLSTRELIQRKAELRHNWERDGTIGDQLAIALPWVEACVSGWSFDAPCDPATMADLLEPLTVIWAGTTAATIAMGGESPEEKKADSPPSTPG